MPLVLSYRLEIKGICDKGCDKQHTKLSCSALIEDFYLDQNRYHQNIMNTIALIELQKRERGVHVTGVREKE